MQGCLITTAKQPAHYRQNSQLISSISVIGRIHGAIVTATVDYRQPVASWLLD